jgi:hypothetical protein
MGRHAPCRRRRRRTSSSLLRSSRLSDASMGMGLGMGGSDRHAGPHPVEIGLMERPLLNGVGGRRSISPLCHRIFGRQGVAACRRSGSSCFLVPRLAKDYAAPLSSQLFDCCLNLLRTSVPLRYCRPAHGQRPRFEWPRPSWAPLRASGSSTSRLHGIGQGTDSRPTPRRPRKCRSRVDRAQTLGASDLFERGFRLSED